MKVTGWCCCCCRWQRWRSGVAGWGGAGLCAVAPTATSYAFGWQDLWKAPDQQGQEALDNGQPDVAAKLFHDPAWKGLLFVRAKIMLPQPEQYAAQKSVDGQYNYVMPRPGW